jgi:hypothetical protein
VEVVIDLVESFWSKALLLVRGGARCILGGFLSEKALATEAAREDTSHSVEKSECVHGVFLKCTPDGLGTEVDKGFAEESGSEFWGGLVTFGALAVAKEIGEELVTDATGFEALLITEIILVSASFPGPNVGGSEAFGVVAEVGDDL